MSNPNLLHSHTSSISILSGTNFLDLSEQVWFHLDVSDIDLALRIVKLLVFIFPISAEEK